MISNIENDVSSEVSKLTGGKSGNIFSAVLGDLSGVENKLLGPDYPYYANINSPSQMGMSSNGSLQTLGTDIEGLISYVEVLVTGQGNASSTGNPLGNKFFLPTGAKCSATDRCTTDSSGKTTCAKVDRYIYIDNVPDGHIPFISSAMGEDFTTFEGLIPGALGNLSVLNPYGIMQAFLSGEAPPCQELTMQTIDVSNNISQATHYVTVSDIKNMDPCIFPNQQNPAAPDKQCKQAFTNNSRQNSNKKKSAALPSDTLAQIYFTSLALIGVYIVYRLMVKSR